MISQEYLELYLRNIRRLISQEYLELYLRNIWNFISGISGTLSQEYLELYLRNIWNFISGISGVITESELYNMTENHTTVRNIWKEGSRTYCISIPIDIVKKLDLDENNTLLVELVDDLIVLKKHKAHLTKTEIYKAKKIKITSNNSETDSTQQIKDNSPNPLDGHEF